MKRQHVGLYVRDLRLKREEERGADFSQRDLARMAGVSSATISRLEGGKTKRGDADTLIAIAPYLGTTPEDLLQRAGLARRHPDPDATLPYPLRTREGVLATLRDIFNSGFWDKALGDSLYRVVAATLGGVPHGRASPPQGQGKSLAEQMEAEFRGGEMDTEWSGVDPTAPDRTASPPEASFSEEEDDAPGAGPA